MSREREDLRRASTPQAAVPAAISDAVELLTGDSGASRTFIGGLIVGALVGAAVAGTSLLRSRAAGDRPLACPTRKR